MEAIVLTDQTIQPDDNLIYTIIGEKQILWQQIMQHLHDQYTDVDEVWKFYNDGKCWLFRTLRKKKTIFWLGVIKDTFRITFYLTDKAEPLIENSTLSEEDKNRYRNAKPSKFGRAVTITMYTHLDVETVNALIDIKLKIK
jgi:hypothetical protein